MKSRFQNTPHPASTWSQSNPHYSWIVLSGVSDQQARNSCVFSLFLSRLVIYRDSRQRDIRSAQCLWSFLFHPCPASRPQLRTGTESITDLPAACTVAGSRIVQLYGLWGQHVKLGGGSAPSVGEANRTDVRTEAGLLSLLMAWQVKPTVNALTDWIVAVAHIFEIIFEISPLQAIRY